MDTKEALDYTLSLAKELHIKDVEVLMARNEELTITVLDGRVEKVDQSTGLGLGMRVVEEGRTGIAYTERFVPAAIEKALRAAKENATMLDPTEVVLNTEIPAVPDPETLQLYNPDLEEVTLKELTDFGLKAEAAAKEADKRVTSVPYMMVSRNSNYYQVVSTHGMDYSQRQNFVDAYCGALLEENGRRKSGGHIWSARKWEPEQAEKLGKEAVRRGAALLKAEKIQGGAIPIVLDEYCAPQILGMYFNAFSAESAQKEMSRLKGRLGDQIAEPSLDLIDDPHMKGGRGSRFLDTEGTPTQPMHLIEGGKFTNFLYHIESARKEGRESTGHAGRSYQGSITTRTHNLVMPTGEHSTQELTALPERCLLVTELEGAAGCDPLSGDISIGVQGFLIVNGNPVQPVDSITIAGNFYDLLLSIKARGNSYQPNLTQLFIPALLVEGLTVSS